MAHLQVFGQGWTAARQKAVDDAKLMQSTVLEECAKSGKPVPNYTLTELIGKGSFGRVYKADSAADGKVVAVKIIDVDESDTVNPKLADTYSEFLKEVNALRVLSEGGAQNINHVLEALPVGHAMWMVTEYCAGGSVATLMKPTAPGGLQEKWIIPILREVGIAIYWVHNQGIIHRDIKCANVLITEVGGVQLCDFGVAGMMETKFDKRSTFIGTPHWMAPELFDPNAQYGTEVDIWAFGSMVYEIASGLPPNVGAPVGLPQFGNFLREHLPRLDGPQYSDDLRSLVAFCLEESPDKRPTIEQVQEHPYIRATSNEYPASSLAALVRAYKLWEERGGSRKSLFNPNIGAQGPIDLASTSMAADEWNFSTTLAFDEHIHDNNDGLTDFDAVRDVYGTQVDFPGSSGMGGEDTAMPKSTKARRRPPPQALAAMRVPLEKVFDPNTISNYVENSQAYYGRPPMPPPASDLPLRDDSLHSTLRESLIDLDASLDGAELSKFADMETIRPGPAPIPGPRASMDNGWSFSAATESQYSRPEPQYSRPESQYSRAPLSDPAELTAGRHEVNWQWPTSIPPASAHPEVASFSFNDNHSQDHPPPTRPRLLHQATEPAGLPSQVSDLQVPRSQNDRLSVSSLIDLDESLGMTIPELTRPSTANSDVGSITGSEAGGPPANPFELERHASVYAPASFNGAREPSLYASAGFGNSVREPSLYAPAAFSNGVREPSIFVSDDSEFASAVAQNNSDIASLSTRNTAMHLNETTMRLEGGLSNGQTKGYQNGHRHRNGRRTPSGGSQGSQIASDVESEYLMTPGGPSPPNHQRQRSQEGDHDRRRRLDSSSPSPSFSSLNGLNRSSFSMESGSLPLPLIPAPSASVMEARAGPGDVANEMKRLIGSLGDHLTIIGNQVAAMEPRRAGAHRLSDVGMQDGINGIDEEDA